MKSEDLKPGDDYGMMREMLQRRFARLVKEESRAAEGEAPAGSDDSFPAWPDLVLIDGGKGQLNAAAEALHGLGLASLPIASLAKREEEVFLFGRSDPLTLSRRSPALRLLQQARDEAHRFAITFQRKRRTVRTITSELLRIPGVGDSKRRLLLSTFGSLQAIREATAEQIGALPGFSVKSGQRILDALRQSDAVAPSPGTPDATTRVDVNDGVGSESPDSEPAFLPTRSDGISALGVGASTDAESEDAPVETISPEPDIPIT
jgi:excinuclease ABC subunit C